MERRPQDNRSGDDTLKTRRERNRQAQHEFRTRRRAAERLRQRRVQHLEETIEKLSDVILAVCDDVLASPEVGGQPGLMLGLQQSVTEALRLVQSVVEPIGAQESMEGFNGEDSASQDGGNIELQEPTSRQQQSPSGHRPQSTIDTDNTQSQTSANDASYATFEQNAYTQTESPSLGWGLSTQSMYAPLHSLNDTDTKSFPIQLVETTLTRACLALGDVSLPSARLKRAFGSMIGKHCTREELLRRVHWLLGPGYSEIYNTAGANWRPSSVHGFNSYDLGYPAFPGTHKHTLSQQKLEQMCERTKRDKLLTALEVATHLERLGASFIGSDTIELRLVEDKDARTYSVTNHTPTTQSAVDRPDVKIWLNSLLLTTNLSSVAECAGFGPAYPRSQIAKAVEASVVFAWDTQDVAF